MLHADLDSFFASVEQRDDPRLRGRPVVVSGGVVLAASYEAKAHGISTPMGIRAARALCPDLIEVKPRFEEYLAASAAVFAIFRDTTPRVEGLSVDEAFLDVAGLRRLAGSPAGIAEGLRRRVAEEVGLPITVGVARTKFLAKMASAAAKPDGLLVISPGAEREFLHPLPIRKMWGVGAVTEQKLRAVGIRTIAELAATDPATLASLLGGHGGRHLWSLANLHDPRPLETGRRRKSIGAQRAIGFGRHTLAELDAALVNLTDRVGRRMRGAQRRGRTVVLRLRFADSSRATRSTTRLLPTDSTADLLQECRRLLQIAMPLVQERGISLIGLSVAGFDHPGQPELPFADDRRTRVDAAMDLVREKFGTASVTQGVLLGRDQGFAAPLLPD